MQENKIAKWTSCISNLATPPPLILGMEERSCVNRHRQRRKGIVTISVWSGDRIQRAVADGTSTFHFDER